MLVFENLTIKDLKNHYFIEDFSYSLGNMERLAIIGEEGNGKSSLLKCIINRKAVEEYMAVNGKIMCDMEHIGYLPQQLPHIWDSVCICDYILKKEPEEELAVERYNELQEFNNLCGRLHLPSDLLLRDQTMGSLSGGEKVKLQILKLMKEPVELLLLDEPTNDLDIAALEWLESFLKSCALPIIFISHDVKLLENSATTILHLEQLNHQSKCRHTIFKGGYREYVETRKAQLDKAIQQARKEKQAYMKQMQKLNDVKNAVHDALNDTVRNPSQAALLKKKMQAIKAQEKRFEKESYAHVDSVEEGIQIFFENVALPVNKTILDMELDCLQVQERALLYDVKLFVKGKDKLILIGDNGTGKSMLLKEIYAQLWQRKDICLGYMPQDYQAKMDYEQTPIEFLAESKDRKDITRVRELLGAMKFTGEEMTHKIRELSEGQKAKLYFLRFIKLRCNVLLLDEPTRNLSPLSSPLIIELLDNFTGCIICVTHDRLLMERLHAMHYEIKDQRLLLCEDRCSE